MKRILFLLFIMATCVVFAQEKTASEVPVPNYRLASKFSPTNLAKLVHSTTVRPNWLKNGNRFWYQYKTSDGANYYLVDADRKTRTKLFDNDKMAEWLTEITKDPYDGQNLPKFSFKFVKNETAMRFRVTSTEEVEVKDDEKDKKAREYTGRWTALRFIVG